MSTPDTDHFSSHASSYARFRPKYPPALFDWLADQAGARTLAWDCGTGNGQAALELAQRFARVHATDLSQAQLNEAPARPNISYVAAPAQQSGLDADSVNLVTVAQALHWFDHARFFAEVKRVLHHGGLFAAWTYRLLDCEPAIDERVAHFHDKTVGPWWPAERHWVDSGYQGLPFPFHEIEAPEFCMECHWTLAEMLDYLRTWSATQRYIKERGNDPTQALAEELAPLWGDTSVARRVSWPLTIRCGRTKTKHRGE